MLKLVATILCDVLLSVSLTTLPFKDNLFAL